MAEKKETSTKNLMLRLPPDQYTMLKALADHHGNSLNSEVLLAIEGAAKAATGLHIPSAQLSTEASNRMRHVPEWTKGLRRYRGSSGLDKEPIERVRMSLEDWLLLHAKLRRELFQLGFATEALDDLMRKLKSADGEVFLRATLTEDDKDLIAMLGTVSGIPALRKNRLNYSAVLEKFIEIAEDLDQLYTQFNTNLDVLRAQDKD